MTVPSEPFTQDAADDEAIEIPPIPVYLTKLPSRRQAPHFGGASFYQVPATPQYVQILPRRPGRFKARIRNNDNANSVVLAETAAKLQAQAVQGYIMPTNAVVEWESQQPLYAAGLTVGLLVSVIDEAYELPDDES